jgi:hypothetical protein
LALVLASQQGYQVYEQSQNRDQQRRTEVTRAVHGI